MDDEVVRFTLILPADTALALDKHCTVQTNRATSVIGSRTEISRSKAIDAILRKALKLPPG